MAKVVSIAEARRKDPWREQRWKWVDAVWIDPNLSHTAKLYAVVLIRHPSGSVGSFLQTTMAQLMGIMGDSESTVRRALAALENGGWIQRSGRGRGVRMTIHFTMLGQRKPVKSDRNNEPENRSNLTKKPVKSDRSPCTPYNDTQILSQSAGAHGCEGNGPEAEKGKSDDPVDDGAKLQAMLAEKIKREVYVAPSAVKPSQARAMLQCGQLEEHHLRHAGIAF